MKKNKIILSIGDLKDIVKEFEELQQDKNKENISLNIGYGLNMELKIIE